MAVRPTMAALIVRLRTMIGDPDPVWSDQQCQDALDRYRQSARLFPLTPHESIAGGGLVSFLEYSAPWGDWEAGATIQTLNFVTLTETTDYTADYLAGRWTLVASHYPPLYLSGNTYDLNLAASEMLQAWAATVALAYDYSQNGQSFHRSQQSTALLHLSRTYAQRGRVTTGRLGRSDTHLGGR